MYAINSVCDLDKRINSIISDFNPCNSESLDSVHNTYNYAYV